MVRASRKRTGPVALTHRVTITDTMTAGELHDRLMQAGGKLMAEAMGKLEAGDLPLTPQTDEGVLYAAKIDKAEARIDWTRPADEVDRLIRGLSPFPGAWTMVEGERVKLLRSRLADGSGRPGEVLHGFTIACGTGAVEVTEAQREGKRPMPSAEVLRGLTLPENL